MRVVNRVVECSHSDLTQRNAFLWLVPLYVHVCVALSVLMLGGIGMIILAFTAGAGAPEARMIGFGSFAGITCVRTT